MSIGLVIFNVLFIILGGISIYYNYKTKSEEAFSFNIKLLEGFLATFVVATIIFLLINNTNKYYTYNPGKTYMLALIIIAIQIIGIVFCLVKKNYKEKVRELGIVAGLTLSIILAVGVYVFIRESGQVLGLEAINFYEILKKSAFELFTVICTAFVCNNLFVNFMFKDKE